MLTEEISTENNFNMGSLILEKCIKKIITTFAHIINSNSISENNSNSKQTSRGHILDELSFENLEKNRFF